MHYDVVMESEYAEQFGPKFNSVCVNYHTQKKTIPNTTVFSAVRTVSSLRKHEVTLLYWDSDLRRHVLWDGHGPFFVFRFVSVLLLLLFSLALLVFVGESRRRGHLFSIHEFVEFLGCIFSKYVSRAQLTIQVSLTPTNMRTKVQNT